MNILEIIKDLPNYLSEIGPFVTFLIVILESILPVLPLSIIIAFAVVSYGFFFGLFISYTGTITGCIISFLVSRYLFKNLIDKFLRKSKSREFLAKIDHLSLGSIVVIMAMPFSPAFLLNIGAGISNISFKKFVIALLIAKSSIVYFWGFVGTNVYESFTNPFVLIKIALMLILSYVLSKFIDKKFSIK